MTNEEYIILFGTPKDPKPADKGGSAIVTLAALAFAFGAFLWLGFVILLLLLFL